MRLTPRQERFVAEYLVDLNSTAAYRRVYPKARQKTAEANGPRLLGKARVAARVAALQAARAKRLELTADRVLRELARIAFSDIADFMTWGPRGVRLKDLADLTPDQTAAIADISETSTGGMRVKLHDKITALTKLGQHLNLFPEKHEHSGTGGGPIEVHQLSPAQRLARIRELLMLGLARAHRNGDGPP